jgi:hypothetical protein
MEGRGKDWPSAGGGTLVMEDGSVHLPQKSSHPWLTGGGVHTSSPPAGVP